MSLRTGSIALLFLLASPALAGAQSSPAPVIASSEEPEEPDFAFLAGGPYTQKAKSIQFISPTRWEWRRGHGQAEQALATLLRFECGITDRLELDVIANGQGLRVRQGPSPLFSFFTRSDTVVGIRYRLLDESSAPDFGLIVQLQFEQVF